jgi:ribonuclease VapC
MQPCSTTSAGSHRDPGYIENHRVLNAEDDAAVYAQAIAGADVRRLAQQAISNAGSSSTRSATRSLAEVWVSSWLARQAHADFGKDSGHPASLNFGDCLSYALALELREPLLGKGDDFGHTGVQSALER